jgi:hypothetical protein
MAQDMSDMTHFLYIERKLNQNNEIHVLGCHAFFMHYWRHCLYAFMPSQNHLISMRDAQYQKANHNSSQKGIQSDPG